jgi:hypothetical protein
LSIGKSPLWAYDNIDQSLRFACSYYPISVQVHGTVTVLAGPVKVRVVEVWQLLYGTIISMRSVCPGAIVSLDGLKLIPGTPVLEADQVRLRLFELLVKET